MVEKKLYLEEIANSITHGIGLVLSLAGFAVLAFMAISQGSIVHLIGCTIYGATLIMVFGASTLYHVILEPHIKHYFRIFDQLTIYLVIAGTYTPFMLINLRGFWGWTLLLTVWSLSLFGIVFKVVYVNRYKAVSMSLYLVMGWLCVIAAKPILASVPLSGLAWIAAGAVAYMAGLVFFAWEKIPYNHTIWHLFVLAGSACHYIAVLNYVMPVRIG